MVTKTDNILPTKITSQLSILIVDDSDEVRHDLRTVLQFAHGLKILGEADNGFDAVSMAKNLKPDIIIMDLRLPGLDGIEAAEQIKKNDYAKAVIMLTIYNQQENRLRAANAGVDAFIEKGSGVKTLLDTIQHVGNIPPQHG